MAIAVIEAVTPVMLKGKTPRATVAEAVERTQEKESEPAQSGLGNAEQAAAITRATA